MSYYASFGHKDFILCLGYRGDLIRQYFLDYNPYVTLDFVMTDGGDTLKPAKSDIHDWRISFVDTGMHSNLGERLVAVRKYVANDDYFLANYSDQLSDLPLDHYVEKAKRKGSVASFVSAKPQQSFHNVETDNEGYVTHLRLAEETDYWVNGGYFLLRKDIFEYIEAGEELVELPFTRLAEKKLLWTHRYSGFWRAMDTFKDKITFDRMDSAGNRPWATHSHNNGKARSE